MLTVHKAKGLEAKVVFILDVTAGTYGFPCEIEDNSIYAPGRINYPDQDQEEEERRLFYVAVTPCKGGPLRLHLGTLKKQVPRRDQRPCA